MRRISSFLGAMLISFFLFSTTASAYDPASISYTRWGESIFFLEDANNITQEDYKMRDYILSVTPGETIQFFKQANVGIHLTHSVPTSARAIDSGYFHGACSAASFSYKNSDKQIVQITAPVDIYVYSNTTHLDAYIHECGHAYDCIAEYITGYYPGDHPISSSTEWQSLYSQYASVMTTFDTGTASNVPRDSCEGFAEAYRLYYVYPSQLQSSCPEVYNFVAAQIAKYQAYTSIVTYDNFDYELYYNTYPDVAAACGLNKDALWNHYSTYGIAEGRYAGKKNP